MRNKGDTMFTFTTDEICELCDLPRQTLLSWVNRGIVAPAIRGGKGRSKPHRYSPQQGIGLAVAATLHQGLRGASTRYVAKVMSQMEQVSDADLKRWLCPDGPWDEEVVAGWKAAAALSGGPIQLTPGEEADFYRFTRVVRESRERLSRAKAEPRGRRKYRALVK